MLDQSRLWNSLWISFSVSLSVGLCYTFLFDQGTESQPQLVPSYLPGTYYAPTPTIDTIRARSPQGISFVYAARRTIPSVVHIRIQKQSSYDTFFQQFFLDEDEGIPLIQATGSGVIISSDGYISTNYHVVEQASTIEVVLNDNRSFVAELVGVDPPTDLALLRIEPTALQPISMGDSDSLEIGEWVLAVGNPFELRSTVTAGIISAKARQINSISGRNSFGIESFIQTDAVVNRGNSGGALVNLRGELVGINTAIFTKTGHYEGYSFAVPVALVQKVMEDLRTYGSVQRAVLGISIRDVDARLAKSKGLTISRGVFIVTVFEDSSAEEAGLEVEDVITAVDGEEVLTTPQLQEKIGRKRPGDMIRVSVLRKGELQEIGVTLKEIPENFAPKP